ncbi:MAG: hypothetical protein ACRYFZ_03100 [Janthinobacterium lividum]
MTCSLPALAWPRGVSWLALAAALAAAAPGHAQQPTADTCAVSQPVLVPVPVRVPRLGLSIILDNRNSFVQESAVRIIGLNVGVVPRGKRYRLGLGAYTLRRNYSDLYTYSGKGKNQRLKDTLTPALDLTYFTPNFTYTFFNRRFIELSVPVDIGLGRSHYTITDEKGKLTTDTKGLFIPAEIGLGVLLKPTRWVGISGTAGYRVSLKEIDYKEDFDGWYYGYRLNLFVGNIWHDCRHYQQRCRAQRLARLAAPAAPKSANP